MAFVHLTKPRCRQGAITAFCHGTANQTLNGRCREAHASTKYSPWPYSTRAVLRAGCQVYMHNFATAHPARKTACILQRQGEFLIEEAT